MEYKNPDAMEQTIVRELDNYGSKHERSKQQLLSDYDIHIKFLSSGCVINVGCKSIAFSSSEEAIAELNRYFENPSKVDDEWQNKFNK
jgi:hypothetical protein